MGEDFKPVKMFFRPKRNWFIELLIKLKIIKPKYIEFVIGKIDNNIYKVTEIIKIETLHLSNINTFRISKASRNQFPKTNTNRHF